MTTAVNTEKDMAEHDRKERSVLPSTYGCEIILEKTTVEQTKDSSFPSDAYLIWYNDGVNDCIDLVRGMRVRIFDMYYDKYGPGAIQKIDFGYGRTSPRLWGYKQPERKKKGR